MADEPEIGIIALTQEAIEKFIKPNVESECDCPVGLFNTVDDKSGMKNAVLMINSDGRVGSSMCGGHHGWFLYFKFLDVRHYTLIRFFNEVRANKASNIRRLWWRYEPVKRRVI